MRSSLPHYQNGVVRMMIALVVVGHIWCVNHHCRFAFHDFDNDDLDVEELVAKASESVHEHVVEPSMLKVLSRMRVVLLIGDPGLEVESIPQIEPIELVSKHGNRLIGHGGQILSEEEANTRNEAVAIVRDVHALQAVTCHEHCKRQIDHHWEAGL